MRRAARAATGASGPAPGRGRLSAAHGGHRRRGVASPPLRSPRPPCAGGVAARRAGAGAWPGRHRRVRAGAASPRARATRAEVRHDARRPARPSRSPARLAPGARVGGGTGSAGPWPPPLARGAVRPRRHAGARRALQRRPRRWCEPVHGAREALDRLRARGRARSAWSPTSPASARGLLTARAGRRGQRRGRGAARARSTRWQVCPHGARGRLRLPQARARAWCSPPRAALGVDPRALRGGRRHRRRRRGRPRGRGARRAGADAGHPRRGGRAPRPRWRARPRRTPSTAPGGGGRGAAARRDPRRPARQRRRRAADRARACGPSPPAPSV